MAPSKKMNGVSSPILSESEDDRPRGPLSIVVPVSEREVIKVNNANLTDLKNACDDAVKRVRRVPFIHLSEGLIDSAMRRAVSFAT